MNERIRDLRKSAGMTQAELARRIGLTQNFVAMIESGAREPGDRTIRDICQAFGVNEIWLRTGAGDMLAAKTREEEMTEAVGRLMATAPDSFKASQVSVMLRFDPDGPEWAVVERIYRSIVAEIEKGPGH